MTGPDRTVRDGLDAELVLGVDPAGLLGQFNLAGVLAAADIHVAATLGRLGGDDDELVALAVALAVRAPRVGHVLVDLATIGQTAVAGFEEEVDLADLPWPSPDQWIERVSFSPLVAPADGEPADRPLRLAGSGLYLDRYWRDEEDVADDLSSRSMASPCDIDEDLLARGLARIYPDDGSYLQRQAASTALHRFLSVIAGGPGTGKTTTVARVLALVAEQAAHRARPLPTVALAAPTGKAAARMAEAVHGEARRLDIDEAVRTWLLSLDASTVHRLLGRRPGTATRFRHDANNQVPYEVVVVDETSMMSLPLMARLVDAVRKDARLVLIGDQEQLASVEAGAVLGDIVGPAAMGTGRRLAPFEPRPTEPRLAEPRLAEPSLAEPRLAEPSLAEPSLAEPSLAEPTGVEPTGLEPGPVDPGAIGPNPFGEPPIARCITVLQANYRFRGPLAELAQAVRSGDADAVMGILSTRSSAGDASHGRSTRLVYEKVVESPFFAHKSSGPGPPGPASDACWLDIDISTAHPTNLELVRSSLVAAQQPLAEAARAGDGPAALDALGRLRLLCAHREGPAGVSTWNSRAEQWLAGVGEGPPPDGGWYLGRPVIVTENDYALGLFNGDTGVVIAEDDSLRVAFRRGAGVVTVSPARLGAVETAFALTVHRAQGSEFDEVIVLLPSASSRVLTRELLYTAVTRARRRVVLVGTGESLRAAVNRPIARASGLTARLWGGARAPTTPVDEL
jgi:exodeoxyribonuclease V alpha subunit